MKAIKNKGQSFNCYRPKRLASYVHRFFCRHLSIYNRSFIFIRRMSLLRCNFQFYTVVFRIQQWLENQRNKETIFNKLRIIDPNKIDYSKNFKSVRTTNQSRNPYITGLRPKPFLSLRVSLYIEDLMKTKSKKQYNPNWNQSSKAA